MSSPILETFELPLHWPTIDPFLFVAHHNDAYPAANEKLAPDASLTGRQVGQDFSNKDGWSMYHGSIVPGFPQHPHRGFETITYVRKGIIDHSDSLGATARFGRGDTQWMTAGGGVQHAEMFPLLNRDGPNHMELFQIWLNLPSGDKMVDPYFTMLWDHCIPKEVTKDADGRAIEITVIAGKLAGHEPSSPPPDSWASKEDADVAIWHIRLDANAQWTLPAALGDSTQRMLYAFDGSSVIVGDSASLAAGNGARIIANEDLVLVAGDSGIECMLLQGRPIGEPVVQYGPFVMNSKDEIAKTFDDYERTKFGGWPWPNPAPDHGAMRGRFALHADGKLETID